MANKTALGVLAVIVLVSMGVGILVGMQLGGSGGSVTGPNQGTGQNSGGGGGGGSGGTATPIPTSVPTTNGTATTTGSTDGQTTVAARRFSRTEIEREVQRLVNRERRDNDLGRLQTDGNTVDKLTRMARGHSNSMADAGRVGHRVNGSNSADRYRANGLYQSCQFESTEGNYIVKADQPEANALEALGQTVAGRPYEVYGESEFNSNESEVAAALTDQMLNTPAFRNRLLYGNADYIGVGVEVTDDGTVYATGDIC